MGTNMYLTLRAATLETAKLQNASISAAAAAAAEGSLMGARGNSGVILSQKRRAVSRTTFATGKRSTRSCSRPRCAKARRPRAAGAGASGRGNDRVGRRCRRRSGLSSRAAREREFYRFVAGVLRAANEALDRTPEQLPALKEAGVVPDRRRRRLRPTFSKEFGVFYPTERYARRPSPAGRSSCQRVHGATSRRREEGTQPNSSSKTQRPDR